MDFALDEPVSGPVDFTLRFDVMRPNYPIEESAMSLPADDDPASDSLAGADDDAYDESFAQAYREGRILVTQRRELNDYVANLPAPEEYSEAEWYALTSTERLVVSGAFQKTDELTVRFTAQSDMAASQSDLPVVQLGDYEVTFSRLDVSFAEASYALTVRKVRGDGRTAAQEFINNDGYWEFAVLMPEGKTTPLADGCGVMDDGDMAYSGTLSLSGPTDALTFVPCWNPVSQNPDEYIARKVYDAGAPITQEQEELMFTVRIQ